MKATPNCEEETMPELPEVETIRRGIMPFVEGQEIVRVVVRNRDLRWPLSNQFASRVTGQIVQVVARRGKYLLLRCAAGTIIIHLGMSGKLSILPLHTAPGKHDHVDFVFSNNQCLRFNDPRRFGSVLWTAEPLAEHPLLAGLGPEPLEAELNATYLYRRSRKRQLAVKQFIMDSHIVVGIGNIYANEALFKAGIHPARPAGRLSVLRYERLVEAIRRVLQDALRQGGTTLRDFCDSNGTPGHFQMMLDVYGRVGQPCKVCGRPIQQVRQGQRSTYFCGRCQR
jgi:formamidopyrimidine-DNA glycosylase